MVKYSVIMKDLSRASYMKDLKWFQDEVSAALNEGWRLQGGVSIAHTGNLIQLAQALITKTQ